MARPAPKRRRRDEAREVKEEEVGVRASLGWGGTARGTIGAPQARRDGLGVLLILVAPNRAAARFAAQTLDSMDLRRPTSGLGRIWILVDTRQAR